MLRVIGAVLTILLILPTFASAGVPEVKNFINNLTTTTINILENEKLNDKTKEQKMTQLFTNSVDLNWMGRFVLGRYYNRISPTERNKYTQAYRDYMVYSYVPKFRSYGGQKVMIKNVRAEEKGEYFVESEIVSEGEPPVRMSYRLRGAGDGYKVVDIIPEGISILTTQRSEFSSIMASGSINDLIAQMKRRTQENRERASEDN